MYRCRRRARGPRRNRRARRRRQRVILLDQEPEVSLGGQAFWSLGGLMFVDSPEQRRCRVGLLRTRPPGLDGHSRLRPPRGRVAPQVGGGVRRLLRRREARLATRPGDALAAEPRLARARRLPRRRARQLGAAVSHHLGDGPGRRRPVRAPRARCRPARASSSFASATASTSSSSPTGPSPESPASCSSRVPSRRGEASGREEAGEFELSSRRGGRDHRRDRRQPRSGARGVAPSDSASRPRTCSPASPRTSTAACWQLPATPGASEINGDRMWHYVEGIHNWDPIWPRGTRSGSSPARRRCGSTRPAGAFRARFTPATTRSAPSRHIQKTGHDYTWFVLTPQDHREGVRALGLRAEPGHHLGELARGAQGAPRPPARRHPCRRSWTTARTSSVKRDLNGLVRRMNALTGEDLIDRADLEAPDRRARPRGRQPLRQGRPDHRDPRRPRLLGRPASPASPRRTASSTRRRGR